MSWPATGDSVTLPEGKGLVVSTAVHDAPDVDHPSPKLDRALEVQAETAKTLETASVRFHNTPDDFELELAAAAEHEAAKREHQTATDRVEWLKALLPPATSEGHVYVADVDLEDGTRITVTSTENEWPHD